MKYGLYSSIDEVYYLQLVEDHYHKLLPVIDCQTKAGKNCIVAKGEILHTILTDDVFIIRSFEGQQNEFTI